MSEQTLSRLGAQQQGRNKDKRFAGHIFDRFSGLDPLFALCEGQSLLDIGSCDGLVAYEFARRGAKVIHGFERDSADVRFAQRLFRDVPAEAVFIESDLAVFSESDPAIFSGSDPAASGGTFAERHGGTLLPRYDIVLFLGVYHHLRRQMGRADLDALVDFLLARAGRFFAVRTPQIEALDPRVLAAGFERTSEHPARGDVGLLRIYERREGGRS